MTVSGRYLLDTSVVIALFAGETGIKDHFVEADQVFVPVVVLGELYFGAQKSGRPLDNLSRIDNFTASCAVLGCDGDTARRCGQIKHALRLKGRPIPKNDIWIGATALQHDLTLVTRDVHFDEVDSLTLARW